MSLKDIFKNSTEISSISSNTSIEDIGSEVESIDLVDSYLVLAKKTKTNIDWSNPENFCYYGSAEKYYEDAIVGIYKTYPYDGSCKEKLQWEISSSDLQVHMFENYYPRNNGYINIGYEYGSSSVSSSGYYDTDTLEYIHFRGTMNPSSDATKSLEHFESSNKLELEKNRGFNLDLKGDSGNTVEFYFKKNDFSGSEKQVIFDLWNSSSAYSDDYGRYRIEVHPGISGEEDKFFLEIRSGSSGFDMEGIGIDLDFTGSWHHYSITTINSGSNLQLKLYVDGILNDTILTGSNIGHVGKAVQGQLGSLITAVSGAASTERGWGKLSGSLDEFRYWKTKRTDKNIRRYYFTQIGGGTNTDDSNTDLGVYFKFNEGICTTSASNLKDYDKIVLDYSGRISNGTWTGYAFGSRNTGSAIVDSGNSEYEFRDPIVYSNQHQVLEVLNGFKSLGTEYDLRNNNSLYNTLPSWMADEDQDNGEPLKNLMQVMAEFFDDLFLKIKFLPEIKNVDHSPNQELSFMKRILDNIGFKSMNVLSDSTLLEEFLTRNENENYEEKFYKIKNKIYKNLYTNISNIYRSKGTNKSFRNLIHCFGIDENLIDINLYANDLEHKFIDRRKHSTIKKKTIDFNNADRFQSTIYQEAESGNSNSAGFISGSSELAKYGATLESSIIFPKKFSKDSSLYIETTFLTSSLFGVNESTDGTWASPNSASIQIYAVREEEDSENARFYLSSSCLSAELTSSLIKNVYNNEKWNFGVSLRRDKDLPVDTSGSNISNYTLEFYGVNMLQDIKQKYFLLTASVSQAAAEDYFAANKMIYAGAYRQNYSGSLLQRTDCKLLSLRYWNNNLSSENIDNHAKDEESFGFARPFETRRGNVRNVDTLVLHWDFQTVTGSDNGLYPSGLATDNDGTFFVNDISSGSLELIETNEISRYTKYQYPAKGNFFLRNDESVVSLEYISNASMNLPENMNSEDLIEILSQDDEIFTKDSEPINHYFSIEKSMNKVVSKEMMNWLGTIKDFNELIGQPKFRYEEKYNSLEYLKTIFFKNVEVESDFERFTDLYKWIDDAIYVGLLQIIPASLNVVENVFNVFESHILERKKYRHKLPTIEFKGGTPESATRNHKARWIGGCNSLYERAQQDMGSRNAVSSVLLNELKRQENLVYSNLLNNPVSILTNQKQNPSLIIGMVQSDPSVGSASTFTNIVPPETCEED